MNKRILNLESLIYDTKARNIAKMQIFEKILEQCHMQIKRFNSEFRLSECYFSIPLIITGIPTNDMPTLINFLIFRITENGLYVQYVPETNQLYISWKEEDINIEKYLTLKHSIESKIDNLTSINMKNMRNGTTLMEDDLVFLRKKEKLARQKQYDREQRFQENIQLKNGKPKSFEDFVKHF